MCMDQCHPICHWRPHIIQEILVSHIKTHNQNARRRVRKISDSGVIQGDRCPLRSSEQGCCHALPNQFAMTHPFSDALLVKRGIFPIYKWTAILEPFDDLCSQQIRIRGYHTFISSSCIWVLQTARFHQLPFWNSQCCLSQDLPNWKVELPPNAVFFLARWRLPLSDCFSRYCLYMVGSSLIRCRQRRMYSVWPVKLDLECERVLCLRPRTAATEKAERNIGKTLGSFLAVSSSSKWCNIYLQSWQDEIRTTTCVTTCCLSLWHFPKIPKPLCHSGFAPSIVAGFLKLPQHFTAGKPHFNLCLMFYL